MEPIVMWKNFIDQSRQTMLSNLEKQIFPCLAGEILYKIIHCQHWEATSFYECENEIRSIPYWTNGIGISQGKVLKLITTYNRKFSESFEHYYLKIELQKENSLNDFFNLYQFYEHTGRGDWNLPCTWEDIFESMFKNYNPCECLKDFLDNPLCQDT